MFLKLFFIYLLFTNVLCESPVYVFNAHSFSGWNPPDASLAVGINRIVSAVNGQIRIFNKDTRTILNTNSLTGFVNKRDAYDPRLIYDSHNDRFVFSCVNGRTGGSSTIELAISQNSSPNNLVNDWLFFSINSGEASLWADFPMMGIDQYNIYITANMFTNNGVFAGSTTNPLWVIRKSVYSGNLQFRKLELPGNVQKFSAQPVWNWDIGPRNYIINQVGNVVLNVWTLSNVQGGNPTITLKSLTAKSQPYSNDGISQRGTNLKIGAGDGRLNNAQVINGKLYTAHTLGNSDSGPNDIGKFIKWYQIDLRNIAIEDDGIIINDDIEFIFGGISSDKNSNLGFTMVGSSPNQYLTQYYSYKLSSEDSQDINVQTRSILGKASQSIFGNTRYGDYSVVALDPFDKQRFWTLNEVPLQGNQWNAYIVSFCPACNLTPETCNLECGVGGKCILERNSKSKCECSTGYIGTSCEICDDQYFRNSEGECEDCGCLNGGFCNSKGKCLCPEKFSGNKCQFEKDSECNLCIHGILLENSECKCFSGYTGNNCHKCKPEHFKVGNNCFDASQCEGKFIDGFCVCSEIRTGPFCEECLIDNCQESCNPECNKYQICVEDPETDEHKCECIEERRGQDCYWCYRGDCTGCPSSDTYMGSRGFCYKETIVCRVGATTSENGLLCDICKTGYFGEYCQACSECPQGTGCDDGVNGSGLCVFG